MDRTHHIMEISHIADRRRVDCHSISSPVAQIYRTHRVSITAVVWLCSSRRRVYHAQQRTAMDARVPGLQISSRPTHRFFVERKSRRFARTNPKHSHIETARCASHGRIIATPSSYCQSFMEIRGHGAEIEGRPCIAFTFVAEGKHC